MQGLPGLTIAVIAIVLAAGACAQAPTPSDSVPPPTDVANATPSSTDTVHESIGEITFDRPIAWAMWQPNDHNPMTGGPLIYLSTDPLRPTCAVAPSASPNPLDACDWPLGTLGPNGVLVTLMDERILRSIPANGEPIVVNDAPTRMLADRPGGCRVVQADETLDVLIPIGQPTPLSNLGVFACVRGPDLAVVEAQFRALLGSITVSER